MQREKATPTAAAAARSARGYGGAAELGCDGAAGWPAAAVQPSHGQQPPVGDQAQRRQVQTHQQGQEQVPGRAARPTAGGASEPGLIKIYGDETKIVKLLYARAYESVWTHQFIAHLPCSTLFTFNCMLCTYFDHRRPWPADQGVVILVL